jgi:alpha-mannosidase
MTPRPELILVCNSHIDPVWLWPWEEGIAATLATFRSAAALCEEFAGFVFCHNEALLYEWVEEYEPALFARIRSLVARGQWHVMGGWYVQPDCNLPAGEALVRQVLVGKTYFLDRFGTEPAVAVNLDPFGHGRGLVQILRRAGYHGYLFCRPDAGALALPADDFVWAGFGGSSILAHRASEHYNSELGKARSKVERALQAHPARQHGLLLWGVGNHGGGPSRDDLAALDALMRSSERTAIRHGRPEDYFETLRAEADPLPRVDRDLNPWGVGCYTSMATVKHQYRRLEAAVVSAETMATSAALQRLAPYPRAELAAALRDLLFCQFHDVLPGSSVAEVEAQALRKLAHGLEIASRIRARTFFALAAGQPPAADGEYPILVYNPHPFVVEDTVVCEMQPPEPNQDRALFLEPEMTAPDGRPLPLQLEKESCNIQADQRKRLVFRARLAASEVSRFGCRLRLVPRGGFQAGEGGHGSEAGSSSGPGPGGGAGDQQPGVRPSQRTLGSRGARLGGGVRRSGGAYPETAAPLAGPFLHRTDEADVVIDATTGLLARYRAGGFDYLGPAACRPLLMRDSPDPWGMKVRSFRDRAGEFALMSPAAAARFAGIQEPALAPVRIIERGPVRTVVEALFEHHGSGLCLRYELPALGSEIEVEARVAWHEKDRMLKLALPTPFTRGRVVGQAAYGAEVFDRPAEELVAQRWVAIVSAEGDRALTVINDATYGFDVVDGELRISLLRAPAYAGHPVDDVTPIVRQDRYEPRLDQADHVFRFWIDGGPAAERLAAVDREASVRNDPPFALCAFPPGSGTRPLPGIVLEDEVVQVGAMKMAETGDRVVVRLFEPTGQARSTTVRIPALGVRFDVPLGGFEVRTFAIDPATKRIEETDLLERAAGPLR